MKGIIRLLAATMIISTINLQSTNAQHTNDLLVPQFNLDHNYEDLADISNEAWDNIGIVTADPIFETETNYTRPTLEDRKTSEYFLSNTQVSFLEMEISNRVDQLVAAFGKDQVGGLQLEMMIDVRGKIAKLEMIDTDMDRKLVRALLHEIEQWTFEYNKGKNTRFSLKVGQ